MRIHHLNCGTMRPFGGRLVDGTGHPFRAARMVCHCLLIETENGLVLVDSGLGTTDIQRPAESLGRRFLVVARPRLDLAETAIQQITRLGHSPQDVRHIVLTHLDLDHAGGLGDFPHAKVHVHGTEHRAAMEPATKLEHGRYRAHQWAHGPHWVTYGSAEGDRWFGFSAVRQLDGLPPEILLIPLPGHTRGHTAVAIRRDDAGDGSDPGWLLHAGDAYFFHGEVNPTEPRSTFGLRLFQTMMQVDGTARHRNQVRLRELAATRSGRVEIFSAHDPVELHRRQDLTAAGAGSASS